MRNIIIGAWGLLLGGLLLTFWSFSQRLDVRGSEHSTGLTRTRTLADIEVPEDVHHVVGVDPKAWRLDDNLQEVAAGRVQYGPPLAEDPSLLSGDAPSDFCKEGGAADVHVSLEKVAIREVTHPLPRELTDGHNISCSWTRLQYRNIPNDNLTICTYSPLVDTVISSSIHREGKWVGVLEWEALLAAGMCTKKRPFVIDVGAGFGSFALMAAAAAGCRVIVFEPHPPNMARMMESFQVNGLLGNATFILNAVHRQEGMVDMSVESHNPGAVRVVRRGSQKQFTAGAIALRDFFGWGGRPRNPYTGFRVSPHDIAAIRVDTEGHGLAVLHSLKELLGRGTPPIVSLHFYPGLSRNGIGCGAREFLDYMYARGFKMYLHKELWSRQRWYDYLDKETWSCQSMLVHRSIANSINLEELQRWDSDVPSPLPAPAVPVAAGGAGEGGDNAAAGDAVAQQRLDAAAAAAAAAAAKKAAAAADAGIDLDAEQRVEGFLLDSLVEDRNAVIPAKEAAAKALRG